jgi:hypothetical protein
VLLRWFRSFVSDELRIFIHPQYILLTHFKRKSSTGFKQQVIQQQVLSVDLSEQSNQWDALKNHLTNAFGSNQWQDAVKQGISARVIISSHFARYAIIPWSVELAAESERQAFMRYRFNTLFGDTVKTWDLRMSEPDFGQPAIASGLDSRLLSTLHEVLTAADMKINSISPYMMLAINQSAPQIKQQKIHSAFWFIVVESERLCFALIENDVWRLVKNVAVEIDLSGQVNTLIQREIVNCHVSSTLPVVIYQAEPDAHPILKIANFPTIKIKSNGFEHTVISTETSVNKWLEARVET